MTTQEMEQRILVLEPELASVKQSIAVRQGEPGWLSRFVGAFDDMPEFDEMVRLGAEMRKADREPETVDRSSQT